MSTFCTPIHIVSCARRFCHRKKMSYVIPGPVCLPRSSFGPSAIFANIFARTAARLNFANGESSWSSNLMALFLPSAARCASGIEWRISRPSLS